MKYLIYLPYPRSCNEAAQKRQLHLAIKAAVHFNPRTSNEPALRTSKPRARSKHTRIWKDALRKTEPL